MRRVLAVLALLVTGACSAPDGGARAEPSGAASPSPSSSSPSSSSPSPSAAEELLPCVPDAEPFTGPAADRYGAERVMAAYCFLVELAEEQERTSLALPIPEQDPREVAALASVLTPPAAVAWGRQVPARTAGEPSASAHVNGLTLHDVREVPRGYRRADDGPYVFGTRVGPATAELARGGAAVRLTFTLETGLVLEKRGDETGRHSLLPVTRRASYVLVPDGDRWLIDDWEAVFGHGEVRLVSG